MFDISVIISLIELIFQAVLVTLALITLLINIFIHIIKNKKQPSLSIPKSLTVTFCINNIGLPLGSPRQYCT